MKIRTDFVTNSSSSSFVVDLTLESADGEELRIHQGEYSGDYEGAAFTVNGNGFDTEDISLNFEDIDPEEIDDVFEGVTYAVQENAFVSYNGTNVEDFISGNRLGSIRRAFGTLDLDLDSDADIDEEGDYGGYYDDGSEVWEMIKPQIEDELEKARETVDGFKDKDISGFSISYEFGGRGEDLAEQGTVLEKIYGEKIAGDLFVALDNGDEDSVKRLLPKHSDEAVTALLSFLDNYEGMADFTFTLNEEGKLDLEISDDVY